MDLDEVDPKSLDVSHDISTLSFRFYTSDEARKLSVRRITSATAFDVLGRPVPRGLYDPALGCTTYAEGSCITCGLSYMNCPGHFGHIELPFPLINPLLFKLLFKVLRGSCWECYSIKTKPRNVPLILAQMQFNDAGLPECARAVDVYRFIVDKHAADPLANRFSLIASTMAEFLKEMPPPLQSHIRNVDPSDLRAVDEAVASAARHAWEDAVERGALLKEPSKVFLTGMKELLGNTGLAKCPKCQRATTKLRMGDHGRVFRALPETKTEVMLSAPELEAQVGSVWKQHSALFELVYGLKGRNIVNGTPPLDHMMFFVQTVLVPPSRFRPSSKVGTMAYAAEHPQNLYFQRIIASMDELLEKPPDPDVDIPAVPSRPRGGRAARGKSDEPFKRTKKTMAVGISEMQEALMELYDNSGTSGGASHEVQATGIRQQLEAKTGLFRQHMMGKRVNFSCRSVIGPDAFLDTNEIGIPESFAKLLSVPEPVTATNLRQMRRAVLNGPDVYPGALSIEDWPRSGDHRIVKFRSSSNKRLLEAQAQLLVQDHRGSGSGPKENGHASRGIHAAPVATINGDGSEDPLSDCRAGSGGKMPKIVHRHLRTGDYVLFNRQPTLHRVSIMAHKVRVLPGDKTIRFHYANCGSYNADFDGDEMNVHVPQDQIARAEAEELMLSSRHYIVPTSGAPIRGLIQDHIAAATLLTRRDTFLDRDSFVQILYAATDRLTSRLDWHGKRYTLPIPAVLKPRALWTGKQLVSAVLDVIRKDRPGLFLEGKTKTTANVIGHEESKVIFRDGQLLQGVIDKSAIGSSIYGIVHAVQEAYGSEASDNFLSAMSRLCVFYLRTHGHTTGVDDLLLNADGEVKRKNCLHKTLGVVGISAANEVYAQMNQGEGSNVKKAKTSAQAQSLIEDMVRRQGREAEDRLDTAMSSALNSVSSDVMKSCIPATLSKAFPHNGFALMTNTGAKGAAVNSAQISCLLGSTVLEGKRVPRMGGSGATLPCFQPFDPSPNAGGFIAGRFLTGIAPFEFFFHAMAGREGLLDTSLKTANSGYLQRCLVKHMEGIRLHYDYTARDSDGSVLQFVYGDDGIDPSKSSWLTSKTDWQIANASVLTSERVGTGRIVTTAKGLLKNALKTPSPSSLDNSTLLELVSPGALSKRGAVSERFEEIIQSALKTNSGQTGTKNVDVRALLEARYQRAAAEPGEAVGIIAAQGVGEPSTQMTLNTFHHAGSSSAHVTLGIPRLRELLMTASPYPKTPSMTLPILGCGDEKSANTLSRRLVSVKMIELLQTVDIVEKEVSLSPALGGLAVRLVKMVIHFAPESMYESDLGFGFDRIVDCTRDGLLAVLHGNIMRDLKRLTTDLAESDDLFSLNTYLAVAEMPSLTIYGNPSKSKGNSKGNKTDEVEEEENYAGAAEDEVGFGGEGKMDDAAEGGAGRPEAADEESNDVESVDSEDSSVGDEEDLGKEVEDTDGIFKEEVEHSKSKTTAKGSAKKKPTEKPGVQVNIRTADGEVGGVADLGALGFVELAPVSEARRSLEISWAFPFELCGRLQLAGMVREAAAGVDLAHVKRITRSFIDSSKGDQLSVITEGSNIGAILELGNGLVDFDRLVTNDMFGILKRYGVEAMRMALIQEFVNVFDAYGIPVNIRHLALIADYMTAHGTYRGFNRRAMDSTPSIFQRMTFETSMVFLTDATVNGVKDHIQNPSTACALGKVYEGGTGGFDLVQSL